MRGWIIFTLITTLVNATIAAAETNWFAAAGWLCAAGAILPRLFQDE